MIGRLVIGAGLVLLGYYVGREVGRTEGVRKELEQARDDNDQEPQPTKSEPPTGK